MSDFNRDGFADLVVGIPGESPGSDPQAGAIAILNGSSNGLVASRVFTQESLDFGTNDAGDGFGEALAVGDFNNDGFDDLIVGIPGESPGGDPRAGAIAILSGSSNGLVASRIEEQESLDLGTNDSEDSFGEALAVGDFNNDGFDDLIVGTPGESPGGDPQSGAISVLQGSSAGLVASRVLEQENLDLGSNDPGDAFGEALAVGDFNNDNYDDLIVGIPGESPGEDPQAGAIAVLNGSSSGLVANRVFEQENLDLGRNDTGDSFGEALTIGDFNNDGFDDLVVGIPGESPGEDPQSGAIAILNGSSEGLVAGRVYTQESLDLGSNDPGDSFGEALTVGDFNNDGFDDLVVGIPGESPGGDPQSGTIAILNGSSEGLVAGQVFSQESLDLGSNDQGDLFGAALTVGDFNEDGFDDLIVGTPGESPGSDPQSGAIAILNGSSEGLVAGRVEEQESLDLGSNDVDDFFGAAVVSSRTDEDSSPPVTPDPLPEGQTGLYRFRNTSYPTGTYLFVGEQERDSILNNADLSRNFSLEGNGNRAFVASTQTADNLIPLYRLRNVDLTGTYLFVSTEEYDAIFAEDSNQRNKWVKEGLDGSGGDIPEFYVYGVGADQGTEFHRFQNRDNNTFLYAGPEETAAINSDPNLSAVFLDQGIAFESL
jgi:FG-GAP repeat